MTTLNFNDLDATDKDNFTSLLGTKLVGIKDKPLIPPKSFIEKYGSVFDPLYEKFANKNFLITGVNGSYDLETKKIHYCFFIEDDLCQGDQSNIEIHELTTYFKLTV